MPTLLEVGVEESGAQAATELRRLVFSNPTFETTPVPAESTAKRNEALEPFKYPVGVTIPVELVNFVGTSRKIIPRGLLVLVVVVIMPRKLPSVVKEVPLAVTPLVGQVPYSEFHAMMAVRMDWATAATSDFLADFIAPLMAGTARPARRPMMEMTTKSSTRVKAAMVRREGLRDEGIKLPRSRPRQEYGVETLTRGFWILDFGFMSEVEPSFVQGSRGR